MRWLALVACALPLAAANYTTYIGDAYTYHVTAMTTDANGNTYVTGSRIVAATDYPPSSLTDVFVSKLDPSGGLTLLATLSGKASDRTNGIALDPEGNIYVVGSTSSANFPLHHPLQSVPSNRGPGAGTGFVVKLSADGTILYSTFLGGTAGYSTMNAVAADSQGNAYVTGETFSPDYPRTDGLPAAAVSGNTIGASSAAFFAKISPAGDKIVYAGGLGATTRACGAGSSCFLSTLSTSGIAIAVDPAGDAYIAGNTFGTGLAGTPGALLSDGIGAFIAKVNTAGTALAYLTFLGNANRPLGIAADPGNRVYAIAADAAGDAYISGSSSDPNFPVSASAFQPKPGFAGDAFVAKLNPAGSAMVWATFLGGSAQDTATTVATDSSGNVWVSGTTRSADFPISSGFPGGSEFLAELNSSGTSLLYGARFPSSTVRTALALDPGGTVHAAGDSGLVSAIDPRQSPGTRLFGIVNAAGGDLTGRVSPAELISIFGLNLGPSAPVSATFNAAGFLPTALDGVEVTINGIPAPLLYVSGTQINAVTPLELVNASTASLRLSINGAALPDFRLVVDPAIPQVFRLADGGTAAINQDGTVNSQANPAPVGSFVSIWATGLGFMGGADGQMSTAAQPLCSCIIHDIASGQDVVPSYAGTAPGTVNGVVQINFRVTGSATYYLSVDAGANRKFSDSFSVSVKP